jgi:integrase
MRFFGRALRPGGSAADRYLDDRTELDVVELDQGGIRFRDLRHSYATWLVSDGVPSTWFAGCSVTSRRRPLSTDTPTSSGTTKNGS